MALALRLGVVALAFGVWFYAIYDVIRTDDVGSRNLPRPVWLVFVLFVPFVGSVAWLVLGKPIREPAAARRAPTAPDEDPDFLERLDDEIRRRRLRRRIEQPDLGDIDAQIEEIEKEEFGPDEDS